MLWVTTDPYITLCTLITEGQRDVFNTGTASYNLEPRSLRGANRPGFCGIVPEYWRYSSVPEGTAYVPDNEGNDKNVNFIRASNCLRAFNNNAYNNDIQHTNYY